MKKIFFGLIGVVLFVLGIWLGFNVLQGEKKAVVKDSKKTAYGEISGDAPPFCSWKAELTDRVMSESKSQAVVVRFTNSAQKNCESSVSLRAPGFTFSPSKEEQSIQLMPKGRGSLSWIITPYKTGTFDISVSDILNTQILGITVTDIFGFSALQAKVFSILGTIF